MCDTDDEFAEIMGANFRAIRELTHVDEAVIVAQIQDLLHSDDDEQRSAGIRLFSKYETSHLVARQRAAVDRVTRARSFLLIEDEDDIKELKKRMSGAAKILDRVLDDLENEEA